MKLADDRVHWLVKGREGENCASWAAAGLCLHERRVNVDRPGGKGGGVFWAKSRERERERERELLPSCFVCFFFSFIPKPFQLISKSF